MQWLIDLVIEAIGVPPCYVNRPDFVGEWLNPGDDFNTNNVFAVDFSPVVPAGAKAVIFRLRAENTVAGLKVFGTKHGEGIGPGHCIFSPPIANLIERSMLTLGCDEDGKCDLQAEPGGFWSNVGISPRGWIL